MDSPLDGVSFSLRQSVVLILLHIDVVGGRVLITHELQLVIHLVDDDQVTGLKAALEKLNAQRIFHEALQGAAQRTCAKLLVVTLFRQPMPCRFRQVDLQAGGRHAFDDTTHLQVDDLLDFSKAQGREDDNLIDAV